MIDETADAIILRWPKARQPVEARRQPASKRLLSLPIFILRLCAEIVGWLAILGFLTQL
jgi:hypothetical protein